MGFGGVGFRVWEVWGLGFRVQGFRVEGSRASFWLSGFAGLSVTKLLGRSSGA